MSDHFHSSVLNPMWSFYAQCCGFEKMNGTDVLLSVPGVTTHNIFNTAQQINQAVGLLQNIADVDFQVETKLIRSLHRVTSSKESSSNRTRWISFGSACIAMEQRPAYMR